MRKLTKFASAVVVCLFSAILLVACGGTKIESAYIKTGTMATTIIKGETLDTSKAIAVVTYSDDKTKEVPNSELTFGTIDTSTTGTKNLEVTYDDFKFYVQIKVVASEADVNTITSFSSDLLTDFAANSSAKENKQEEFFQLNKTHLVGDDNALDFRINAKGINADGELVEGLTKVRTTIKIEEISGSTSNPVYTELTGSNLSAKVDYIDTEMSTIDFSNNAINKQFRITVSAVNYDPTMFDEQNPASFTAVVKVVDGYNVYNAQQLSVMDNGNRDNSWTSLKEQWGLTGINPKAVVLQSSIKITDNDIPARHFYTQEEVNGLSADIKNKTNQPIVGSMKDEHTEIYYRLVANGESFNFYGNYFDIDVAEVSRSVIDSDKNGVRVAEGEGDASYITTHIPLMRIYGGKYENTKLTQVNLGVGENTNGEVNLVDTYFIGNGERSANPLASGGMILLKTAGVNFEANNTIHKNFFIGYFAEYGYNLDTTGVTDQQQIKNIKNDGNPDKNNEYRFIDCKGYNAYNTLYYLWGASNVYMENNEMIGAGGPAIIADHVTSVNDFKKQTGEGGFPTNLNIVNSKNSKIESWVNGYEPWFATYDGASQQFASLTTVNTSIYDKMGYGFVKSIDGVDGFMNLIIVHKWGIKKFNEDKAMTRGTTNIFDTVEDYNAYMETGKLADGSTYYGYNKSMSYAGDSYAYESNAVKAFLQYAQGGAPVGFEASTSGHIAIPTGETAAMPLGNKITDGKQLNIYMANGFGAVVDLFKK